MTALSDITFLLNDVLQAPAQWQALPKERMVVNQKNAHGRPRFDTKP